MASNEQYFQALKNTIAEESALLDLVKDIIPVRDYFDRARRIAKLNTLLSVIRTGQHNG